MSKHGAKAYKTTAVTTASREQVLVMLYEAAIKHVKKATVAIDQGDIKAKCIAIGKAHDIVNELMSSLNFEQGGDIAVQLERLYTFIVEQLVRGNLENSKARLESCEKVLTTLLDGWRGAIEKLKTENGRQKGS